VAVAAPTLKVEAIAMTRAMVADVMTTKVVSVRTSSTYQQLVSLLITQRISAVPVLDHRDRVVGVVSEADLLGRLTLRRRRRTWRHGAAAPKRALTAGGLMTSPPVTALATTPIIVAAQRMRGAHVKRLPVVDDLGRLVGIVSRADLLRVFLRDDYVIQAEVSDDVLRRGFLLGPQSIDAEVREGVVTLRGELSNAELIDLVAAEVGEVEGVVDVRNLLRTPASR
jgi:CBS domain-containing protein